MIVAIDASILIFLFERDAKSPINPATEQPLERCYDRVNHLIAELQANAAKIVIPTPALAEILVNAGDAGPEWLRIIEKSPHFMVAQFDKLAAAEHAARMIDRPRPIPQGKRKAKFDDQIIAISRLAGAEVIYSDDGDIRKDAGPGIRVVGTCDLELPPEDPQGQLFA